jgi:hypothetical protein
MNEDATDETAEAGWPFPSLLSNCLHKACVCVALLELNPHDAALLARQSLSLLGACL